MVLMAGSVRAVADCRVLGKHARLGYVGACIRYRLVDVESIVSLTGVGSNVGETKTGIPLLALHSQVVLHGVGNAQVWINCLRESDCRRPCNAGGRKDIRQYHGGNAAWIIKAWFVDDVGNASRAQGAWNDVVEEPESSTDHCVIPGRANSKADAWCKIVPVSSDEALTR